MSDVVERMENLLVMYEEDVVEFPKWELRDAITEIKTLTTDGRILREGLETIAHQFACSDAGMVAQTVLHRAQDRQEPK